MTLPSFAEYFRALWGFDPFPWQQRLSVEIEKMRLSKDFENAGWPAWLTLPTGTGKTAALDVAIYDLARQAERPMNQRTAPVRIVFAVNRRIVVDEAYERAMTIAAKLAIACGHRRNQDFQLKCHLTEDQAALLKPVAVALQKLSGLGNGLPLETYPLRGATFTDHSWARTPTQPLVITTTLDQLGSRLLFRGYGVSPNARPIHAALLANDALLILDEAHTAKAFSQTLEAVAQLREKSVDPIKLPFAVVQLTATPPASVGDVFPLGDDPADPSTASASRKRERKIFSLGDDDHADPIIHARLNAAKPAELRLVEGAAGKTARHAKMAEAMMSKAIALTSEGIRHILIVVNRIATADAVLEKLCPAKGKLPHNAEVRLLTGRLRPLDRDDLIAYINRWLKPKPGASTPDVPLILIATQCIEVGADYDFDALLTELAPLDSLRQRFGRLNRQGRDIPAPAVIFAPDEALDLAKPDPLYGPCLTPVWIWLHENSGEEGTVNFGLQSMIGIMPAGETLDAMLAPAANAPLLLEPHLDLLCQTSPEPYVCPDPSLYIHGPGKSFPEVSVVLRADLTAGDNALEMLETLPPIGTESATVPLHHAREWLEKAAKAVDGGGDVPDALEDSWTRGEVAIKNAIRWNAGEGFPLKSPNDLRPGDILVLSAQTEALGNLFPVSDEKEPWALDQYERAHLLSRDRLAIRFHTGIKAELQRLIPEGKARDAFRVLTEPLFAKDEDEGKWQFSEAAWKNTISALATLLAENLPADHPWKQLWTHAAWLKNEKPRPKDDWKIVPYPGKTLDGVIFFNRTRVGATPWPFDPADLGQQGSQALDAVSLAEHSQAVKDRAASNARDLPASLAGTVRDAGAWHDLGKLDPRFQAMLRGCSLWAVESKDPLAKSGPRTLALQQFLSTRAELPKHFRHELLSALIVELSAAGREHPEHDLLLHLIASHHGRCRAMAPVIHDENPEPFDVEVAGEPLRFGGQDCPLAHLSQGVARRFWSLNRRFGWWGLPYLETLLRLADQYASANPNPSTPS